MTFVVNMLKPERLHPESRVLSIMPRVAKDTTRTKDEHIFPETKIRPLVFNWKRLVAEEKTWEAMDLLEVIINDSTEMFKRLAQHEKFHHTVPLDSLVAAAQEKIPKWLMKWDPAKGSLFSWLSTCAKNVFRSELVKTTTFTKRVHCTDDDAALERLSGFTDDGQDSKDRSDAIHAKIKGMTAPWASEEMRGAIRYIIECIMEEDHRRQDCIRGAAFAWGLSMDTTKFLYSWTHVQMKVELFDETYTRFTDHDLFVASYRNTPWPQIVEMIGWDVAKKVFACAGGQRLKVPTVGELGRLMQQGRMVQEILKSDKDPDAMSKIAKRFSKTEKSATDIYVTLTGIMNPANSGEFPVYDDYQRDERDEREEDDSL